MGVSLGHLTWNHGLLEAVDRRHGRGIDQRRSVDSDVDLEVAEGEPESARVVSGGPRSRATRIAESVPTSSCPCCH